MRRAVVVAVVAALPASAMAQTRAPAAPSASPAPSATSAPPAPPEGSPQEDPHASRPTRPELPKDEVGIDPALPAGTIVARLLDAEERPLAGQEAVLDVDRNTVAQGESHEERTANVDELGIVRFDGLAIGSGTSYRIRTRRGEATFASSAFVLKEQGGAWVVLHAYEPETALERSLVALRARLILEIKQDTVRVNHLLQFFNPGPTAFVPRGLAMPLPAGARAFNQEQSSGLLSMVEHDGEVRLEGTLPPGQAQIIYGYTLPLDSGPELHLNLPLPPRVLSAEVFVNAGPGMSLDVKGFKEGGKDRGPNGQSMRWAQGSLAQPRSLAEHLANVRNGELDITVSGLPSSGNGPLLAVVLGAFAVAAGILQARRRGTNTERVELARELAEARDTLLDELAALERARGAGDVGPKSYERLRSALLDALARVLARLEAQQPSPSGRSPAREIK